MGPCVLKKMEGPSILLFGKIPKNWRGPGPPCPLGDYTPGMYKLENLLESAIKGTLEPKIVLQRLCAESSV